MSASRGSSQFVIGEPIVLKAGTAVGQAVAAAERSTLTAAAAVFTVAVAGVSADHGEYVVFDTSGVQYPVLSITSTKIAILGGDASGEKAGDTFKVTRTITITTKTAKTLAVRPVGGDAELCQAFGGTANYPLDDGVDRYFSADLVGEKFVFIGDQNTSLRSIQQSGYHYAS
jgi:hypothetical protein